MMKLVTKPKEKKNKKNGSKKKAQSVQYSSWWKQGYIKMVMSEDHASCWVHKDLTVTAKQIQKTAGKWQKCESYFGALTPWLAAWAGHALGGSAPHQCR